MLHKRSRPHSVSDYWSTNRSAKRVPVTLAPRIRHTAKLATVSNNNSFSYQLRALPQIESCSCKSFLSAKYPFLAANTVTAAVMNYFAATCSLCFFCPLPLQKQKAAVQRQNYLSFLSSQKIIETKFVAARATCDVKAWTLLSCSNAQYLSLQS